MLMFLLKDADVLQNFCPYFSKKNPSRSCISREIPRSAKDYEGIL